MVSLRLLCLYFYSACDRLGTLTYNMGLLMGTFETIAAAIYPKDLIEEEEYAQNDCLHDWVYQPAEYETLDGRQTMEQYPALWYCKHCDAILEDD